MSETFDCEIQARLRDMNLGGHVDSVEAVRIIDEARLLFLRFADLGLPGVASEPGRHGVLRDVPSGVAELVASQRIDYHAEMRFTAYQPFLARLWVSRIGRSSLTVSTELRVAPDHPPAVVAQTAVVLWDGAAGSAWPMTEGIRAALETYLGDPVAMRATD